MWIELTKVDVLKEDDGDEIVGMKIFSTRHTDLINTDNVNCFETVNLEGTVNIEYAKKETHIVCEAHFTNGDSCSYELPKDTLRRIILK